MCVCVCFIPLVDGKANWDLSFFLQNFIYQHKLSRIIFHPLLGISSFVFSDPLPLSVVFTTLIQMCGGDIYWLMLPLVSCFFLRLFLYNIFLDGLLDSDKNIGKIVMEIEIPHTSSTHSAPWIHWLLIIMSFLLSSSLRKHQRAF